MTAIILTDTVIARQFILDVNDYFCVTYLHNYRFCTVDRQVCRRRPRDDKIRKICPQFRSLAMNFNILVLRHSLSYIDNCVGLDITSTLHKLHTYGDCNLDNFLLLIVLPYKKHHQNLVFVIHFLMRIP